MTLLDEIFGSPYLKASDIKKPVEVVIEKVEVIKFDEADKLCISFDRCEKKFICNRTNAFVIGAAYGRETNDWRGKRIILGTHQTPLGPGIEVRIPAKTDPVFVPDADDGVPF